jgi:hypothetical protein
MPAHSITSTATPGDIGRYTQGECHVLAVALHRRFGWPIYLVLDAGEPYWTDPEDDDNTISTVCHAYAICPDGLAWDVRGAQTLDAVRQEAQDLWAISIYDTDTLYNEEELRLYVGCWSNDEWMVDRPLEFYDEQDVAAAQAVLSRIFESQPLFASESSRSARPQRVIHA